MRQAGRYLPEYRALRAEAGSFLELCYNPALASEVTLQPVRRFGMDAAILFADILLIPHALGQKLDYREGEGPVLEAIIGPADLKRLDTAHLDSILAPVYQTVAATAQALAPEVALIGFAGAPWTVATYMVEGGGSRDFAMVKQWAYGDPDSFQRLIDIITDATIHYLVAQIRAGADAVQLFDTWASALSESGFDRWCIAPASRIVAAIRDACPGIPVIGFPKGAGAMTKSYVSKSKVDGIGLDWTMPLDFTREVLQPLATPQGNLDPAYLRIGGRAMLDEAARILEILGTGPLIFNLGHGVTPQVPPEHVAELSDFLKSYRR